MDSLLNVEILNLFLSSASFLINLKPETKIPTLVIGAGISGLSAANLLNKVEIFDVKILEARNRIGGRIHTVPVGDSKALVDLGAQNIHGMGKGALNDYNGLWKNQYNPIYNIAKQNRFKIQRSSDEYERYFKMKMYMEDGSTKIPKKLRRYFE